MESFRKLSPLEGINPKILLMAARSIRFFMGLFWILVVFGSATAQESLNCSGGDASATTGSVAFSIGQPVFHTWYGPSNSLSEGVQQPYDWSGQGFHLADSESQLSIYPNPADQRLFFQWKGGMSDKMLIRVLDGLGRMILEQPVLSFPGYIDIESFPASFYFLQVQNEEMKTLATKKFLKIP